MHDLQDLVVQPLSSDTHNTLRDTLSRPSHRPCGTLHFIMRNISNGKTRRNSVHTNTKAHAYPRRLQNLTHSIRTRQSSDIRINAYLSHKGITTRRGADDLIKRGLVTINGRTAVIGDRVSLDEDVQIRHFITAPHRYLAYHKPCGIITHSPQRGEKAIEDVVPINGVFPIGRLDKDSSGLILLTDDGRITERLLHPRYYHEKEYAVTIQEKVTDAFVKKMAGGVVIGTERTRKAAVTKVTAHTFHIVLTEGKKHQIRRMCAACNASVMSLVRIRVMNIALGDMKVGTWRTIKGAELKNFLELLDLIYEHTTLPPKRNRG
jgi:23S rRNA pseudouridine2604 synthase